MPQAGCPLPRVWVVQCVEGREQLEKLLGDRDPRPSGPHGGLAGTGHCLTSTRIRAVITPV